MPDCKKGYTNLQMRRALTLALQKAEILEIQQSIL